MPMFSQVGSQSLLAVVPLCHVAYERHYPLNRVVDALQKLDRELNRDLPAVLAKRRHREQLALTVSGRAGPHGGFPSGPMPRAKAFRDDQIHRSSDCLCFTESKHPLGRWIPIAHSARAVANQDRIWRTV